MKLKCVIFLLFCLENFLFVSCEFDCDIQDVLESRGDTVKLHISQTPKVIHLEPRTTYE